MFFLSEPHCRNRDQSNIWSPKEKLDSSNDAGKRTLAFRGWPTNFSSELSNWRLWAWDILLYTCWIIVSSCFLPGINAFFIFVPFLSQCQAKCLEAHCVSLGLRIAMLEVLRLRPLSSILEPPLFSLGLLRRMMDDKDWLNTENYGQQRNWSWNCFEDSKIYIDQLKKLSTQFNTQFALRLCVGHRQHFKRIHLLQEHRWSHKVRTRRCCRHVLDLEEGCILIGCTSDHLLLSSTSEIFEVKMWKNPEDLRIFSNFHTPQGYRSQKISDLPTFNFILHLFVLLNPVTSWCNLARDLSSQKLPKGESDYIVIWMCVCINIIYIYFLSLSSLNLSELISLCRVSLSSLRRNDKWRKSEHLIHEVN